MSADRLAFFYALGAVLLWSTVATAFKLTLAYMSPLQMLTAASTVSWLALLVITWQQGKLTGVVAEWASAPKFYLGLGALNPGIYYLVLFAAYARLPASQAQPLNYTWAIALTFLAGVVLKQKIRRRDWLAAALGYFGVLVIATRGDVLSFTAAMESPFGVGLALLSTVLWASYWILNTRRQSEPVISLLLSFSVATPVLWVASFCFGTGGSSGFASWTGIPWQGWLAVTYVGLFEMGITFFLWLKALRLTTNVSLISNLIFISPFISLVLLATIIGETIYPATVLGLVFIVGALLVQRVTAKSFVPLKQWRSRNR